MIIQSLKGYYDRVAADPGSGIPQPGWEYKEICFLIVVDDKGNFIDVEDTRELVEGRLVPKAFLVPQSAPRSGTKSYQTTFLLWDHGGYVLGITNSQDKAELALNQHKTWLDFLSKLPDELLKDAGVIAVREFYNNDGVARVMESHLADEIMKNAYRNFSFRLLDDLVPVPCRPNIKQYVDRSITDRLSGNEEHGVCMITGEYGPIARIHSKTYITRDSHTLVGVQKNRGFDSYGKEQGYNSPIIKSTEFSYTTALNTLLKKDSRQRLLIGDATTVFWSEKPTDFESDFPMFFQHPEKDDPAAHTEKIRALYDSINTGAYVEHDGDTMFYILGLSPNSARISVRFWHMGTISEFAIRIKEYFDDFKIIKPPSEPEFYSIWQVLVNIAVQNKSANIPPNLAGEFMRSILDGTPYPNTLFQAALRRIKSDAEYRVKPVRAALIKAYLNRYYRFYPNQKYKEVGIELDINQPSTGYQLGRLFAVLEKIQEEANPGINTTIRERYYGAACATPVTVFANLIRLKNHHLAKLENKGRATNFEKLLGEIIEKVHDFPAHLDLHEQGRFAIGYYHQRQAFFVKKDQQNAINE